jgi:hypothetical protein
LRDDWRDGKHSHRDDESGRLQIIDRQVLVFGSPEAVELHIPEIVQRADLQLLVFRRDVFQLRKRGPVLNRLRVFLVPVMAGAGVEQRFCDVGGFGEADFFWRAAFIGRGA